MRPLLTLLAALSLSWLSVRAEAWLAESLGTPAEIEAALGTPAAHAVFITDAVAGPDGTVYLLDANNDRILKRTPAGQFLLHSPADPNLRVWRYAAGSLVALPSGDLLQPHSDASLLRITPDGARARQPLVQPPDIAAEFFSVVGLCLLPDGNLCYVGIREIGKISPAGVVERWRTLAEMGIAKDEFIFVSAGLTRDGTGALLFATSSGLKRWHPAAGLDESFSQTVFARSVPENLSVVALADGTTFYINSSGVLFQMKADGSTTPILGNASTLGFTWQFTPGLGGAVTLPAFSTYTRLMSAPGGGLFLASPAGLQWLRPVDAAPPPIILSSPRQWEGAARRTTPVAVSAYSEAPCRYDWYLGGTHLGTTSTPEFDLPVTQATEATIRVVVTNASGSTEARLGQLLADAPAFGPGTTQHAVAGSPTLRAIAASPTLAVAVGDAHTVLTSPDGARWTPASLPGPSEDWRAIVRGRTHFVAVSHQGSVLASPDGRQWETVAHTPQGQALRQIAYSEDTYVACGDGGTILTSTNAVTWTPRASGTTEDLVAAVAVPSSLDLPRWVVGSRQGTLFSSASGQNWEAQPRPSRPLPSLRALGPGLTRYAKLLVANDEDTLSTTTLYSPETAFFAQWVREPGPIVAEKIPPIQGLTAIGTYTYLCTADGGLYALHSNYPVPSRIPTDTTVTLTGATVFDGHLLAVGENLTIVRSRPVSPATLTNLSALATQYPGEGATFISWDPLRPDADPVLARGIGPSLAAFGVPAWAPQTALTWHESASGQTTFWSAGTRGPDALTLASIGERYGAFALPAASNDTAVVLAEPNRHPLLQVEANGRTLTELYFPSGYTEGQRFSVRAPVGSRAQPLILGFTLTGDRAREIELRGYSEALAPLGIQTRAAHLALTPILPDPYATYDGRRDYRANRNDQEDSPLGSAQTSLSARLMPGTYQIAVHGWNSAFEEIPQGIVYLELTLLPEPFE